MLRLVCILFLLLPLPGLSQSRHWAVLPGSTLTIDGKTNINTFCCRSTYTGGDTLRVLALADQIEIKTGAVHLPTRNIRCGNPMMTSDLRRTLQAETHPNVRIRLVRLHGSVPPSHAERQIDTELEVTLAGRSRLVRMPCTLLAEAHNLVLSGRHVFRFDEFGLVPPERLFGTVQVAQELDVSFRLLLAPLP